MGQPLMMRREKKRVERGSRTGRNEKREKYLICSLKVQNVFNGGRTNEITSSWKQVCLSVQSSLPTRLISQSIVISVCWRRLNNHFMFRVRHMRECFKCCDKQHRFHKESVSPYFGLHNNEHTFLRTKLPSTKHFHHYPTILNRKKTLIS